MATANVVQTSISGGHSNALAIQGDGAFLPKLDTASRLALTLGTPDKGLMVYDTTLTTICVWNGTAWEFIADNSNLIVSVKDFGAKGDGVTNDTAAIQAALAAFPGRTIFFPDGVYIVSGPITITADGTAIIGTMSGKMSYTGSTPVPAGGATIIQTQINSHTLNFTPASSSTQYIRNVAVKGITFQYTFAAVNGATSGTAIRFERCDNYVVEDVVINDAFEAIGVLGGYGGRLHNFRTTANLGSATSVGYNGMVSFKSSSYGGTYQPCSVVEVSDFLINQGKRRNYSVIVESSDGLHFSNGYVAGAIESIVLVRPSVSGGSILSSDYVGSLMFSNVYFDGVTTTPSSTLGSKRALEISGGIGGNSRVYGVSVGTGCFLGNCSEDALTIDYQTVAGFLYQSTGAQYQNCLRQGIYVDGPALSEMRLILTGNIFTQVGDVTNGAIRISDVSALMLTGNYFSQSAGPCVTLAGTVGTATLNSNFNNTVNADIANGATITTRYTASGNGGFYTGSSSWRGVRPGNYAVADTNTLDWYEEGTATPSISFAGGNTGITYGTRGTTWTRIGNTVYFSTRISLTSKGSSTGALFIFSGNPYTSSSSQPITPLSVRVNALDPIVGGNAVFASIQASSTAAEMFFLSGGSQVQMTDVHLQNTSSLIVSGFYFVN